MAEEEQELVVEQVTEQIQHEVTEQEEQEVVVEEQEVTEQENLEVAEQEEHAVVEQEKQEVTEQDQGEQEVTQQDQEVTQQDQGEQEVTQQEQEEQEVIEHEVMKQGEHEVIEQKEHEVVEPKKVQCTTVFSEKRRNVLRDGKAKRQARLAPVRRKLAADERAAASRVPLEMLAREWLNEHKASLDTRSYMVEKLLPTLVVGLDKLLTEVSSRDLVESTEQQEDFNPINFIAQYLMRNNPRYSNFAEAHPYCKNMKQVREDLKRAAYSMDQNKLAELKTRSKQRCQVREEEEQRQIAEQNRRLGLVKGVFDKWLVHGEERISLNEVKQDLVMRVGCYD